ncbi:hypothetical protein D3870_00425 [Noviherbaspirillum cavernae]|uniref:Fatty acid desaturase domain-containing protein n=1 Tax=Noviherbaspirillum cavernae TaxID=2320862 RepID=A0A418WWR9_9BURK|nr:fatty acid desaturase family protein [Noviherbaspirillum cavernae]RJG04688.1 hypothetical protein D3870_00425 [Noviherbaspirillum cavernae]
MHPNPSPTRHAHARISLERDLLKQLAEPVPARLLLQTLFEWTCIVLLIAAACHFSNIAITLACMLLIATRQHALLALMHEFSHYQFSRRLAWLNDLIGDVLTAFPFFITIHGFRRNHMPHHRHVSTEQDPNWMSSLRKERYRFPKSRTRFFLEMLKHCVGVHTLDDLKGYTLDAGMALDLPRATRIARLVFALALAGLASWFGLWWTLLLYWIVPLATFLMAILYIRDVGEHFGMPAAGFAGSRTVRAGWLERILICQNGVNFHAEHHLFPSVPFFRLAQLHEALIENDEYRRNAVVTQGYLTGLIDEVTGAPDTAGKLRRA